jgi:hypothetical protein
MGKRRWKANSNVKTDDRSFLKRYRLPIALATVIAAVIGVFFYRYINSDHQYGDATTDYERAMAQCIQDHTRAAGDDSSADEAAAACVQETPGGQ